MITLIDHHCQTQLNPTRDGLQQISVMNSVQYHSFDKNTGSIILLLHNYVQAIIGSH